MIKARKNLIIAIILIIFGLSNINAEENNHEFKLTPEKHHYLAIELNMQTWNLLSKDKRTKKENVRMINYAFASHYHWFKSPKWKPINEQRGEWLISHVYAVLKKGKKALKHAKKCKSITKKLNLKGFDLAYSYEALARAYASLGNKKKLNKYYILAKEAGGRIKNEKNKKIFFNDLKSQPWFK